MSRFDIATGQPRAWSILTRSHAAGKVASTYLIHGPEGVGAWSLALEFAALLNCEAPGGEPDAPESTRPCGTCRSCRGIFDLNFEGLHLIVPVSKHKNHSEAIDLTNELLDQRREEPFRLLDQSAPISIPIDLARETKRRLAIGAPAGTTRVVVFYRMDKMRSASADALLKLIEEPPANTVLILTAVRPEALLDTIRSRSQEIRLERLPEPPVVDYLKEHYQVSDTRARLAARVSEGSLGRAIEMAAVDDSEGADARSVGLLLFNTLLTQPASEVVSQMGELLNFRDRGAAAELIRLWQSLFRDAAYYAGTGDESALVNVDFASEIKQVSGGLIDPAVVTRVVDTTKNTLADLERNVHIQPALVAMALKLKSDLEAAGQAVAQE